MAETLKPFERRYTPEQTRAIVYAVVDRKPRMTVRAAVEAAAAGALPGWEGAAFGKQRREDGSWEPIPTATAYAWRREELDARIVKSHGRLAKSTDGEHAARLVLNSAWDDLEKAMKAARLKKMTPAQRMRTVKEYAATGMYLRKCEAEMGIKPSGAPDEPEKPARKARNTEADALARAARERAQTEHHDVKTPDTQQGQGPATGNGHHAESNQGASDSTTRT